MRSAQHSLQVKTAGQGLYEITADVAQWVAQQTMRSALLTIFLRHTSASLVIQENAAADVRADLEDFFRALAPEDARRYRHQDEGPDDMPAHIRTILTQNSLCIPISESDCDLGTWQGVFVWEHRAQQHRRRITVSVVG